MVEQFCRSILQIVGLKTKALANLVMGLASQTFASSVVEVSLSETYHYQYSSITKTVKALDKPLRKRNAKAKEAENESAKKDKLSRKEVEKKFAIKGRIFRKAI